MRNLTELGSYPVTGCHLDGSRSCAPGRVFLQELPRLNDILPICTSAEDVIA